jgi:hypothetical protein
MEFANGF